MGESNVPTIEQQPVKYDAEDKQMKLHGSKDGADDVRMQAGMNEDAQTLFVYG